MRRATLLTAFMSSVLCGILSAQAEPAAPATTPSSILVAPPTFARWDGDAHLSSTGLNTSVPLDTSRVWWGVGTGATIGATAGLAATQAFCGDDNGCVARSIGAILMGSFLGGAIESGMDY